MGERTTVRCAGDQHPRRRMERERLSRFDLLREWIVCCGRTQGWR
nr:MAG TPA: hypothetical protein [Bacteriophage sp.]